MPDSAMLAVCVPDPAATWNEGIATARRIASEPGALDAALEAAVQKAAAFFNVPDGESFSDIARVRGLDPNAPVGLFVGASHGDGEGPASDSATAGDPPESLPPTSSLTGLNAVLRELGAAVPDGAGAGETAARTSSLEVAVVLRCAEPEVSEGMLQEMIPASAAGDPVEDTPEEAHGVCIHYYGPGLPCYFLAGTRLVVGTGPGLVRAIAARLGDPMEVRYGTSACPAAPDDDAVALIRPGEVRDWVSGITGAGEGGTAAGWLDSLLTASRGPDPAVVTVRISDKKLAVTSRIDYKTHPDLRAYHGAAFPLRHPGFYPETAPLMTSVALTDARKQRFVEGWLSAIPRQIIETGPRADQVAGMVRRIVSLLGDEASLAVLGMDEGFPRMAGAVAIGNTQEVYEFLLTLGLDLNPVASYGRTDILVLPLGSVAPVDVYYALVDNTLIAATDPAALRGVLERGATDDGGASPAVSPTGTAPAGYQVLVAREGFVADVAVPLLGLTGMVEGETADRLRSVAPLLHEARYSVKMTQGWRVSELALGSD